MPVPVQKSQGKPHTDNGANIKDFGSNLLSITARLFGRMNMSMDIAETIMFDFYDILELTGSFYQSNLEHACSDFSFENQDIIKHSLISSTRKVQNALQKLNTEYKVQTTLIEKNIMKLPKKHVFDEKEMQVGDDFKTLKSETVILPIEHQIKSFLERRGILDSILANQAELEHCSGSINNFITAQRWKEVKNTFNGKTVIPIFVYNDDFGPDDGLSPHNSSNKISAYYYSFPTLPPYVSSRLESIFVAMLVKSKDVKNVGPNEVLRILVEELKPFEEDGILVKDQVIFIAPVLFLGDNMGLNYNLGLPGHRANFFCKTCYMPRDRTETCCEEDVSLIRTKEHYKACLDALERNDKENTFGILFETNLNTLNSFMLTDCLVADSMHDLLSSGVFVYAIVELLKKSINEKKITLRDFNDEKNKFDYGKKEKQYTIRDITQNHLANGNIRAHARETLTLVKYLPAILSKLLPANCPLRKFSGIMNDLLQICLKNHYTDEDLSIMTLTVSTFNHEFLRLFHTSENIRPLPPKAHNLLHYARIIKNSGPLKKMWSMRFESKHQECKAYAKVCHSRRNLCYSAAKKICHKNAYSILEDENLLQKITNYKAISDNMKMCFDHPNTKSCAHATYKGRLYSLGEFIISKCLNNAYKILDIGVNVATDQMYVVVGVYNITLNKTLRMYKLENNNHVNECKNIDELLHPPISIHKFSGCYYLHHEEF